VKHSIAVIDQDQAFTTILKEGLEATGDYDVTAIHVSNVALDTVASRPFDMVIVDMGLEGMSPASLITGIRALRPSIRVMLIPISGNQIPEDLRDFEIDGLLPKPFFVGDLPAIVQHALYLDDAPPSRPTRIPDRSTPTAPTAPPAKALAHEQHGQRATQPDNPRTTGPGTSVDKALVPEQPASPVEIAPQVPDKRPAEPVSPPQPAPAATPRPEPKSAKSLPPSQKQGSTVDLDRWLARATPITRILQALNREIHAEAIMVTAADQLIACAGSMDRERISQMSNLAAQYAEMAGRLMSSLGKQGEHVEQSLSEGARHTIYTLRLSQELMLTVAASSSTPAGTIRYRARKAGDEISDLL
jgi:DNA-binding NarL/FixJ family response regulator/predicted regulator of Ras-like GTPase activity (Roadblock/LC7/MglB family)